MTNALPTVWEFLTWVMAPKWQGIPIAALIELTLVGGLLFGAPGSGKTTAIRGAIQAAAASGMGAVIIDPKRSPELRQLVWALGGRVWTIGGAEVWNPLEADPEVMAEQLLEGEPEDRAAPRVFREGARLAARQLGRALAQAGGPGARAARPVQPGHQVPGPQPPHRRLGVPGPAGAAQRPPGPPGPT